MVFGSEKEEFAKNEIRKKIMELQIEINESIKRKCIKQYGKHEFERERDYNPESWWVCKNCGFEK
jgi:hypothetical protein